MKMYLNYYKKILQRKVLSHFMVIKYVHAECRMSLMQPILG